MKNIIGTIIFISLILSACSQNKQTQQVQMNRAERVERALKELKERGWSLDSITDTERQDLLDTLNVAELERLILWHDEINLLPDEPNMHQIDTVHECEDFYNEQIGLVYLDLDKINRRIFVEELRKLSCIMDKTLRDSCFYEWGKKYNLNLVDN